jgi:hypothetical protein
MLNVILGGSANSSTWLTCFFLYMILYPNVQSKIHEELDKVVGRDRLPKGASHIFKLPCMKSEGYQV